MQLKTGYKNELYNSIKMIFYCISFAFSNKILCLVKFHFIGALSDCKAE